MVRLYKIVVSLLILLSATFSVVAQTTVSGVVNDDTGQPLPGATVLIDGTTRGTTTDLDGKYTLVVNPGEVVLVYSFIGYKTFKKAFTVKEGENQTFTYKMESDALLLDNVVVVGYGVQRKREVTGSISKIDGAKLTELPVPSFEAALGGQGSGIQVTQGSGAAGSGSVVRVRGIASVSAGGDPLYVVDGIPITQDYFLRGNSGGFNNNPLASINPNDIESIEVLKDASATGIYGSRGANGVILITTKRAKKQGVSYDFSSRVGISTPTARPEMLNSEQFLQLYQEAWENDGNTGLAPLPGGISWDDARQTNTDWVDETIGTGVKQNYSLSVRKGGKKLKAYINGTYDDNESFLIGNSYERLSGRLNLDYSISKNLTARLSSSLSRGQNNRVANGWSGGLGEAMSTALPIYPIRNPDGSYFEGGSNPVRQRELQEWRNTEYRSINSLSLEYAPTEKIFLKATGGYDHMDLREDIYEPAEFINVTDHAGVAKRFPTWVNNVNYSITGNYLTTINNQHKFNFMVGHELQYSRTDLYDTYEFTNMNGPLYSEDPDFNDTNSIATINRGATRKTAFISYFGRVNYVFKDKYIFQGTGRVDGSSRFGSNNRYGFFPSVSAGWIVSEENFLKDSKVISYLKIKTSYGIVGNASIPDYEWIGTVQNNDSPGYNGEAFTYPNKRENPDLKWETSNTFDAGVEIGLFADRFTAELAYYNKITSDVLMNLNVPKSTGFESYYENVGEVLNTGVELSLKSRNLVGEFQWTTDFNIARNYNEVRNTGVFSEEAVSGGTNDTRVVVGEPVGTNYLVRFSHVDRQTGRPVYLDKDGNETFTWDPNNRVAVGDILPDVVGGITNSFRYKKWDLSFLVYFSIGAKIYDSSSKRQLGVVTDWNMRPEIFDRWRQPGDDAKYPVLTRESSTYGASTNWINTDLWLHDADYARLRTLTLGYNFGNFPVSKLNIVNCRVYFNATNLWTITNFEGLDPEIARDFENNADRNMSSNITFLTPPQERAYTLGINFSF